MADAERPIKVPPPMSRAAGAYAWLSAVNDRYSLARRLAILLTIVALASAFATYAAITGTSPFGVDTRTILVLLQIDLVVFLLLGLVVARNLVGLWMERRRGQVGSRLHTRLVVLFSLIALAPAIVVSGFSAFFFNYGMENWFSERVRTAIIDSRAVAAAYLKEHQQVIRGDVLSIARDLDPAIPLLDESPRQFQRLLAAQGMIRNLSEIYLLDGSARVLAQWSLGFVLDRGPVSLNAIERARKGEVVILTSETDDRLRAVIKLDRIVDTFLYVGRYVEPNVLEHIDKTQRAAREYEEIEGRRSTIEITFAMIFILVGLLLLFVAIWIGLVFANRLSRPISDLASAAERVREGDLSTRVREEPNSDELGLLSRAFNRMTDQLEGQRHELVEANRQLDERRHFIETVLGGVSAGVIGVDENGRINLANRSANSLLSKNLDSEIGNMIGDVVPEFNDLISRTTVRPNSLVEAQVIIQGKRRPSTLFVRVAADVVSDRIVGFVVTFDDITELVGAQRKAAWSDVARRIAHEIKNPLTPIQLSAERLRRKYLSEITSDPDTFSNCTDTIIRQVGDIGRMVDEFSSFARMPRPEMEETNLVSICKEAVVLPRNAHPEIRFDLKFPDEPVWISADPRQLSQVMTNLLQNALDAIDGRRQVQAESSPGEVCIKVSVLGEDALIEVLDNGTGLPPGAPDRLTEPYVTSRTKGTGLGLAIVKTILEDHGAGLRLEDGEVNGARVEVKIPLFERKGKADPSIAGDG
ncbi:MAG: Sensor protein kinase WalK [Alphaproteobacteria bacterium MarineAlpha11_Bin1]|nr:MAG: Sensor protein kinase WalK [Alphaproteobacteria bacterium MarineAlpha11_Bin1]